eukprot:jgi/Hompol1/3006/HPOL_006289-RA
MSLQTQRNMLENLFLHKLEMRIPGLFVDALSRTASQIINCNPGNLETLPPPLPVFISSLIKTAQVDSPVLMLALIYFQRLKKLLPPTAKGMPCTVHRITLATLIVAEKFLCDVPMRNRSWAAHSTVFSLEEVNLMERQLLHLLDFNLYVTELEFLKVIEHDLGLSAFLSQTPEALHLSMLNLRQPPAPIKQYAPSNACFSRNVHACELVGHQSVIGVEQSDRFNSVHTVQMQGALQSYSMDPRNQASIPERYLPKHAIKPQQQQQQQQQRQQQQHQFGTMQTQTSQNTAATKPKNDEWFAVPASAKFWDSQHRRVIVANPQPMPVGNIQQQDSAVSLYHSVQGNPGNARVVMSSLLASGSSGAIAVAGDMVSVPQPSVLMMTTMRPLQATM